MAQPLVLKTFTSVEDQGKTKIQATVMGWSASTSVRMAKRYGHIGQAAQREGVKALEGVSFQGDGAQNWAQPRAIGTSVLPN